MSKTQNNIGRKDYVIVQTKNQKKKKKKKIQKLFKTRCIYPPTYFCNSKTEDFTLEKR